jgi:pyruvate dehydrogenase E1 component alpha subunit
MPSFQVDGMKCETVHDAIFEAAERARRGDGPTFLEIKTYRFRGHSMSDPAKYRSKEELEEYKEKDPINQVLNTIMANNFATEADIEAINEKVRLEVEEAVQFAEESPYPDASELFKDIYAQEDYPYIVD